MGLPAPKPVNFPTRTSGPGRTRDPNPFDDYVKQSYDENRAYSWTAAQLKSTGLEVKKILELIRRSATYFNIGVDTYVDEKGGVTFQAREKRVVNRKPRTSAVVAQEA